MSAAKFACDNLVAIVDWNKVQLDGLAKDVMPIGDLAAKWASFGWKVYECDGHNIAQLYNAIEAAKNAADPMTRVVLANTIKGKGVSFMDGTNKFHGKAITDEEYELAMRELRGAK